MSKSASVFMAIGLIMALLHILNGCSNPADSDGSWKLIWQDEFNGTAGQLPDAAKWDYDTGGDGWGNAQLEYNTNRPENVSLDGNGNLAIIAREESYGGRNYTSARIVTRDLFEPVYGRFEARIKLPIGQGIWPAFWLLGSNIETVSWPQCGEIDIMEYRGQQPEIIHGSLHGPGYSGGEALTRSHTLTGSTFNSDFHIFAIEWSSDVIRWYVDNTHYLTVIPSSTDGDPWVFDHPFYMILNVAVGGNFVGPPNTSTEFPQTMLIDYVRAYQKN